MKPEQEQIEEIAKQICEAVVRDVDIERIADEMRQEYEK